MKEIKVRSSATLVATFTNALNSSIQSEIRLLIYRLIYCTSKEKIEIETEIENQNTFFSLSQVIVIITDLTSTIIWTLLILKCYQNFKNIFFVYSLIYLLFTLTSLSIVRVIKLCLYDLYDLHSFAFVFFCIGNIGTSRVPLFCCFMKNIYP